MPIKICERCQTRYVYDESNGDFVHDCGVAESTTLRDEDVINLGPATDFKNTGQETTGGRGSKFEVFYQGVENQLFGTRAAIEGEDFEGVTVRGNRSSTHRSRKYFEYKKLK